MVEGFLVLRVCSVKICLQFTDKYKFDEFVEKLYVRMVFWQYFAQKSRLRFKIFYFPDLAVFFNVVSSLLSSATSSLLILLFLQTFSLLYKKKKNMVFSNTRIRHGSM